MNFLILLGSVFLLGGGSYSTFAQDSGAPSTSASVGWGKKMKELESLLKEILVDASSEARFNQPTQKKKIDERILKFSKLSHDLQMDSSHAPDADPTIGMIAGEFSNEMKNIQQSLKWGRRSYARNSIRSMTQYCMACHSKNINGPQLSGLSIAPKELAEGSLERGDYWVAVREFDRALDTYKNVLKKEIDQKRMTASFEKAVRHSVSILVRVKQDPKATLELMQLVLQFKEMPAYLREQYLSWNRSVENWIKEEKKQGSKNNSTQNTEQSLYESANQLFQEGRTLQKYPLDRSADIYFLRASVKVHDLLRIAPRGKYASEGLYLAGMVYDILGSTDLWDPSSLYYLGCISQFPHTEQARKCYQQYEEKIYFNYSGSSGIHIPDEIKSDLNRLDLLSQPKPALKKGRR